MSVSLFSGNEQILLDGIEVDVKTGEFHSFSASVTQFAIESGAIAADHIVEQPATLEIPFKISNRDEAGRSYGTRAATIFSSLEQRLRRRQLYEVVTRHRLYPSMAIVSLKMENVSPFTGAISGRISFQEVNRDRLNRVRLPVARVPRKRTASSQQDAGRVDGKTPTDADKKNTRASLLSQIFRSAK